MTTAQITLSESESQAIDALGQSKGKTQEEILHEAIEQFLKQHQVENRLAALRQARGIWQERQTCPISPNCETRGTDPRNMITYARTSAN